MESVALLNEFDLAKMLRVSVSTLRRWRVLKKGPPYLKAGASVRYRSEDIQAWLTSVSKGGEDPLGAG
jgi:hypothetical protein